MRFVPRVAFIAFGILSVSASASSAQDGGFGVTGGVSIATQQISGVSNAPSLGTRVGAVAGAFYTLPIGSWLGMQVEGLYVTKGSKVDEFNIASTVLIDYFEVPILARVRLGSGHTHYYVAGGVAPAFRVRARVRTSFPGATEELDVSDQVERFDLGVAGGGGIVIGPFSIDGRYTFGVRDIDADKTDSSRTKNRALTLAAGFRF